MAKYIDIIPSKSFGHRALIAASLAGKKTRVVCKVTSDDIAATKKCLAAMEEGKEEMEVGESGTTLRFLIPIMGALGKRAVFLTEGRLADRPLSPLREALVEHGMSISENGTSPIVVSGKLRPGLFRIRGDVSSQFISGLLMALPLLDEDSVVEVDGELQSSRYVDITLSVLRDFGIQIDVSSGISISYHVKGGQKYKGPDVYQVEGDWSSAAFWLTAGAIGSEAITVGNLNLNSLQGDRRIADILKQFGAKVTLGQNSVTVSPGHLSGSRIDVSGIPDLAPELAVLAVSAQGPSEIVNAGRLRLKESDRIRSITTVMKELGADIIEGRDSILVGGTGGRKIRGGEVDSFNDHRIAMMAAVASLITENPVRIRRSACVRKSYPGFFKDMKVLGLDGNVRAK